MRKMSSPFVNIKQGTLKGCVLDNVEGGQYYGFLGIPYARPPVGELRFKDPQSPLPWDGIRDAHQEGEMPIQIGCFERNIIMGDEDCLFLNVFTNSFSKKRPVLVYIFGGIFLFNSGNRDNCSPDYFLQHDTVVVTFNYRLGVLGFLNMEVESCSGNQGLKDQVCALQWVQENIEAFGGDKNNVTICGNSSGGACVHFLCLSPLAKGLFHKAIIQSCSVHSPLYYRKSTKDLGLKIAALLGKETSDVEEALKFLHTVQPETFTEVLERKEISSDPSLALLFTATLDNMSLNPFAPRPISEMVKEGINVPLIIGFNIHEGSSCLSVPDFKAENKFTALEENFESYLAFHLGKTDLTKMPDFLNDVKKFYFKNKPISIEQTENYVKFTGDLRFVNPIQQCIETQMGKSTPTYVYIFAHLTEVSYFKLVNPLLDTRGLVGPAHTDEVPFILYLVKFGDRVILKKGSKDHLVMQKMTKMWTDFMKTGNPTPKLDELITEEWLPITSERKFFMEISDELKLGENPGKEVWEFWKSKNAYI